METSKNLSGWTAAVLIAVVLWPAGAAWGQRIRIPSTTTPTTVFQGSGMDSLAPAPAQPPTIGVPPGTTLGQPAFDPYASSSSAASMPPSLGTSSFSATPSFNPGSPPTYPTPEGAYPSPAYSSQPPVLYPNCGTPNCGTPTTGFWPQAETGPYMRFCQDVRIRQTWLAGSNNASDMQANDTEVATTINFPNFLWTNQPIHLSPTFILHLWDGPNTSGFVPPMGMPTALPPEMPSKAYSAYLSTRWQPKLTPAFGGDVEFNVGIYSDFNSIDEDSIRLTGTGLFTAALTPTLTIKGGITYLDRVDLKMLPAGGVLWIPNPHTRFDIYFPRPKLAQYLTTIGNTDVWWFVAAEYGGGSWTVDRLGLNPGDDRRVDINDIRVGGGLEWTGLRASRGFIEGAYVFNRELVFASRSAGDLSLDDAFMIRGGLAY